MGGCFLGLVVNLAVAWSSECLVCPPRANPVLRMSDLPNLHPAAVTIQIDHHTSSHRATEADSGRRQADVCRHHGTIEE